MSRWKTSKKERAEEKEKRLRAYFLRLFGKYNFRNEQQFLLFGKWLIFLALTTMELLLLWQYVVHFQENGGLPRLIVFLALAFVLSLSEAVNLFVVKNERLRTTLYAADVLLSCGFLFVTTGTYPLLLYMLSLTQLYMSTEKLKPAFVSWICSMPLYILAYWLQSRVWLHWNLGVAETLQRTFGALVGISLHFIGVQIALAFYRQYLRLNQTLDELAESQKELEKAYAVVAEVTALEERQRIAKDIHDTAGHSLTTVIMQTEAAKRLLEQNPEEAKSKIVAANLQAKHALEELRDSVHLLSGYGENDTLKAELEGILHDSTDGTGIKIRSDVDEVEYISPAKRRFLCNTLKEGISNGLRHGGATAFWFELKRNADSLTFFLSDNGKGVTTETLREGFGLTTMRERAKSLGGEISFRAERDEGFEIALTLPMDTKE